MSTGYLDIEARRPGAMIAVVAIHAAGIGALMMIAPTVVDRFQKPLIGEMIPLPPVPPKVIADAPIKVKAKAPLQRDRPERRVDSRPAGSDTALANDTGSLTSADADIGNGIDLIEIDPPRDPVIVGARFAGRHAQPPYPPAMQRMSIEGAVTVRVLVGVDGRPLRVEAVKVDQDAFFAATRDWAMKHWRFTPATRDGEPFQEWRTMTVRFEID